MYGLAELVAMLAKVQEDHLFAEAPEQPEPLVLTTVGGGTFTIPMTTTGNNITLHSGDSVTWTADVSWDWDDGNGNSGTYFFTNHTH